MAETRRIDSRFETLLDKFRLETLERELGSVYGLWPDLTFCYLNAGWFRFAEENAGREVIARYPLGTNILSAISGPLREFFAMAFGTVLARGVPWAHDYDVRPRRSSGGITRTYIHSVTERPSS